MWTRPLIREQVRVRIKRFLEVIKLRRDLYMTQNYLDTAIDRVRAIITAEQCKINGEEVDWIINKYKEDL